ncbi:hypothetical protein Osc1_09410 [Hominimerdicola sp. 21CYCFAH17_S]
MKIRKLTGLLCAVSVLLSFSACGSKENSEDKSSSEATTSSAEVTEKETAENRTEASDEEETKVPSANSDEDINDVVIKDIEDTLAALSSEYETLKSEIDTYTKFLSGTEKMDDFCARVYDTNYNLCVKMCEYSLEYAEDIVNSGMSNDDKYDELDELYDSIYDDGGEEIYDGIYDGILEDMYDDFYDGLLDDAYDNEEYSEYSEWYDMRSNEYERWYDTRSDVYEDWYDMRSDIYEFWTDLRSELWDDDIEKAKKKIEDFREDVEKIKEDAGQADNNTSDSEENTESDSETETKVPEEDKPAENLVDGMRPEFKEALDSYEDFFDEYCDFMKKFNESPDDLSLLSEYTEYLTQYSETMEKMSELDDGEMNDAEMKYYLEVTNRISQKLLDAAL